LTNNCHIKYNNGEAPSNWWAVGYITPKGGEANAYNITCW